MELTWIFFAWSTIWLLPGLWLLRRLRQKAPECSEHMAPGPPGWPIVGNLFDLGKVPHETLAGLAKKYGPVLQLQLGMVNTVVIQSAKASKELFKNHDLSFAGRTISEAVKACDYYQESLAFAQYGRHWRTLRRIYSTELSVNKQNKGTVPLRRKCIDDLIHWIDKEAQMHGDTCGVDLSRLISLMNFNMIGNIMLSRDLVDPQSKEGSEFFEAMDRAIEQTGTANMADFFPCLKWLDPQRIRIKTEKYLGRSVEIVSGFVRKRMENQQLDKEKTRRDFLDVLLAFEGDGKEETAKFSEKNVIMMILEMFIAGTETASSTVEWAMTELLRNPEKMNKVRMELGEVVQRNRKVEESDIDNLPYLKAVAKETLRLHPPIPFLVPRRAVQDNNFMGYWIPKDSQVLVNAWAIGRDPDSWDDPLSFKPERFLGSDIDYQGHHFELIPFGAGRRICPGLPLAQRIFHLTLGSLLHTYDWELNKHVTADTLDTKERLGIARRMAVPLKVRPRKRNAWSVQLSRNMDRCRCNKELVELSQINRNIVQPWF